MTTRLLLLGLATLLAGCGGDEGGPAGPVAPPTTAPAPTPTPTVSVVLSETAENLRISHAGGDLGFQATVSGVVPGMIADVEYDRAQIRLRTTLTPTSEGVYRVRFALAPALANGTYDGAVVFRMCADPACVNVVPGSTKRYAYQMQVVPGDWVTFQGNASHDGFVHASFEPARFAKAWEVIPEGATRLSDISASDGLAYVTSRQRDGTSVIHALSTSTGEQRWIYSLGRVHSAGGPAVGDTRVFAASMVMSSSENSVVAIDARSGQFKGPNGTFASQWSEFMQPTPFGKGVYMAAGYFGGVVYGFDYSAMSRWTAEPGGGIWDGETPAVDADTVYYYGGRGVDLIDRFDGTVKRRLDDPFFQSNGYGYSGAPILGSLGNVMAYSGHRNASAPSVLVNWSIALGTVLWRSADSYVTTPAVADGVVYLARNDPARLDALDERTGARMWSWTPPAGERFIGNTIATRNLVFVSTDKAIYALPLGGTAPTPLWSAPVAGHLAITADGFLIVGVQTREQNAWVSQATRLAAYRLW